MGDIYRIELNDDKFTLSVKCKDLLIDSGYDHIVLLDKNGAIYSVEHGVLSTAILQYALPKQLQ